MLRLVLASMVLSAGCLDPVAGRVEAPVLGDAAPDRSEAAALVRWTDSGDMIFVCSAARVRPDAVLTAAHCLDRRLPSAVLVGPTLGTAWASPAVIEVVSHPDWEGDQDHDDDLGVVHHEPVEDGDWVPVNDRDAQDLQDVVAEQIGFGGPDDMPLEERPRRMATGRIGYIYTASMLADPVEGALCGGDSGGPWIADTGRGAELVGISSYVIGDCEADYENSGSPRLDLHAEWLDEQLGPWTAPAADPPEEPDDEDGSACAGPGSLAALALVLPPGIGRRRGRQSMRSRSPCSSTQGCCRAS